MWKRCVKALSRPKVAPTMKYLSDLVPPHVEKQISKLNHKERNAKLDALMGCTESEVAPKS